MHTEKLGDTSNMLGNTKYPWVRFAAELPVHLPVVGVGGVVNAVSAPSCTGALSPRKLALSNV